MHFVWTFVLDSSILVQYMNTIHAKTLKKINLRLNNLEAKAACTCGHQVEIDALDDYHLKVMDFIADALTQAHDDAFKAGILAGQKGVIL